MAELIDLDRYRHLVAKLAPHGSLRRSWRLTGGVSAEITAIEIARPDGSIERLIVRRHGAVDLSQNPRVASDEFRLLEILRGRGVPAPRPLLYDDSGEHVSTPILVVEYIEGDTEFEPADLAAYVSQAAAQLARIHQARDSPEISFLARQEPRVDRRPTQTDGSMGEERIWDALIERRPAVQMNASVLLHGDFWPGNLLWRDGRLVGVIDWEDARIGDPLADLANARLEFMMAFGPNAADTFTNDYQAGPALDLTNLPYWDLRAALRPCGKLSEWGLDEATETRMRERHASFVSRALLAISQIENDTT